MCVFFLRYGFCFLGGNGRQKTLFFFNCVLLIWNSFCSKVANIVLFKFFLAARTPGSVLCRVPSVCGIPSFDPLATLKLKLLGNKNFGFRKSEQNRSQNGTEKGSEKRHLKK